MKNPEDELKKHTNKIIDSDGKQWDRIETLGCISKDDGGGAVWKLSGGGKIKMKKKPPRMV